LLPGRASPDCPADTIGKEARLWRLRSNSQIGPVIVSFTRGQDNRVGAPTQITMACP
jgi:hypothetical protein